jgi:hypothetical protein
MAKTTPPKGSPIIHVPNPDYQNCVTEDGSCYVDMLVIRSADHYNNGVKICTAEINAMDNVTTRNAEIGLIVPTGQKESWSTVRYDYDNAIPDNTPVEVLWLHPGDRVWVRATAADHGAQKRGGIAVPQTSGTLGDRDAVAANDIQTHAFMYLDEIDTSDTYVPVEYRGLIGADAA